MESIVHAVEGDCEAYHQKGTETKVILSNDCIVSLEKKFIKGTGFRVFIGGHQGFAYSTDERRLKEVAEFAAKLARTSSEVKRTPIPEEYPQVDGLFDPRLGELDVETVTGMAEDMLQGAAENKGHIIYGEINITELYHEIVTSYGIQGDFHETLCVAGVDVEVDGVFGSKTLYRRDSNFRLFDLGKKAAELATASRDPQRIEGGDMPVILKPPAASKLLEHVIVPLLLADNRESAQSFYDRMGRITSEMTIVDDGTLEKGIGSRPFDGEGSPSRETVAIENGLLQTFLFDTTTAFDNQVRSTGNAVRSSFRTPPVIYISNLILRPEFRTSTLIEDTKSGILINDIMGSFSADFTTGKFGFDAKNVFLVENGEMRYPVDDVPIVGDITEIFRGIEPGDDVEQEGLLQVPSTRIHASVMI
ncbi:MAG: TldD/PmbA family protein [Theionarchaea archaeon]|nr:TldD/PmbA family protein [Theionarchaea archaeon]